MIDVTLQQVQSGCSSHLQDCSSMHLDTMEAHTASLQAVTGGVRLARVTRRRVVRRAWDLMS